MDEGAVGRPAPDGPPIEPVTEPPAEPVVAGKPTRAKRKSADRQV
jgi:hypothetical protein